MPGGDSRTSLEEFAQAKADFLGDLNAIHPFREASANLAQSLLRRSTSTGPGFVARPGAGFCRPIHGAGKSEML